MGAVTSTPVLRVRVDSKSPFKGVRHFRMTVSDFNFEPSLLPDKLNGVELACVVFGNEPFPEETHADAFYYTEGVVTVSAGGECVYVE